MSKIESEDPNIITHRVIGAPGQVTDLFTVEKNDGTEVFAIDKDGNIGTVGTGVSVGYVIYQVGESYFAKNGATGIIQFSEIGDVGALINSCLTADPCQMTDVYITRGDSDYYTKTCIVIHNRQSVTSAPGVGIVSRSITDIMPGMIVFGTGDGTRVRGRLSGVRLEGQGATAYAVNYGVVFQLTGACEVRDCEILDFASACIDFRGNVVDVNIEHNRFEPTIGADSCILFRIQTPATWGNNACTIEHCQFRSGASATAGIKIYDGGAGRLRVRFCDIDVVGDGIHILADETYGASVNIEDSWFEHNGATSTQTGLFINGTTPGIVNMFCSIKNCHLGNYDVGIVANYTQGFSIEGCSFDDIATHCIRLENNATETIIKGPYWFHWGHEGHEPSDELYDAGTRTAWRDPPFEQEGTVTIPSGETTVAVTHHCYETPAHFDFCGYNNDSYNFYPSEIGPTTFVLNRINGPESGDRVVFWHARMGVPIV